MTENDKVSSWEKMTKNDWKWHSKDQIYVLKLMWYLNINYSISSISKIQWSFFEEGCKQQIPKKMHTVLRIRFWTKKKFDHSNNPFSDEEPKWPILTICRNFFRHVPVTFLIIVINRFNVSTSFPGFCIHVFFYKKPDFFGQPGSFSNFGLFSALRFLKCFLIFSL